MGSFKVILQDSKDSSTYGKLALKEALREKLSLDSKHLDTLFTDFPIIVTQGVDEETAIQLVRLLEEIGGIAAMEKELELPVAHIDESDEFDDLMDDLESELSTIENFSANPKDTATSLESLICQEDLASIDSISTEAVNDISELQFESSDSLEVEELSENLVEEINNLNTAETVQLDSKNKEKILSQVMSELELDDSSSEDIDNDSVENIKPEEPQKPSIETKNPLELEVADTEELVKEDLSDLLSQIDEELDLSDELPSIEPTGEVNEEEEEQLQQFLSSFGPSASDKPTQTEGLEFGEIETEEPDTKDEPEAKEKPKDDGNSLMFEIDEDSTEETKEEVSKEEKTEKKAESKNEEIDSTGIELDLSFDTSEDETKADSPDLFETLQTDSDETENLPEEGEAPSGLNFEAEETIPTPETSPGSNPEANQSETEEKEEKEQPEIDPSLAFTKNQQIKPEEVSKDPLPVKQVEEELDKQPTPNASSSQSLRISASRRVSQKKPVNKFLVAACLLTMFSGLLFKVFVLDSRREPSVEIKTPSLKKMLETRRKYKAKREEENEKARLRALKASITSSFWDAEETSSGILSRVRLKITDKQGKLIGGAVIIEQEASKKLTPLQIVNNKKRAAWLKRFTLKVKKPSPVTGPMNKNQIFEYTGSGYAYFSDGQVEGRTNAKLTLRGTKNNSNRIVVHWELRTPKSSKLTNESKRISSDKYEASYQGSVTLKKELKSSKK